MTYDFKVSATARIAACALMGLALSFGGAAGAAGAAPQAAETGALKPYRSDEFEKVILPDSPELYVGKTLRLKVDLSETILLGLGYRYVAENTQAIRAVVGGVPFSEPAGSLFTRRNVTGGRIAELPENAMILCQESRQRNFGQSLASAATLGLTQLAARYSENIQLCGVDGDRDGSLEKLFLVGAKLQEDLEFTSITPVPYNSGENYPVNDVKLVLYPVKPWFSSPALALGVQANGRLTALSSIQFYTDKKGASENGTVWFKKNKLPKTVNLGSASLIIKAYDEVAGTVDIEFTKFFEIQKVDWYIAPQTIYVYY